jgi:hypothetical protein
LVECAKVRKLECHTILVAETCGIRTIQVNGQRVEEVTKLDYLRLRVIRNPSSKPKIEVKGKNDFVSFPRWISFGQRAVLVQEEIATVQLRSLPRLRATSVTRCAPMMA